MTVLSTEACQCIPLAEGQRTIRLSVPREVVQDSADCVESHEAALEACRAELTLQIEALETLAVPDRMRQRARARKSTHGGKQ